MEVITRNQITKLHIDVSISVIRIPFFPINAPTFKKDLVSPESKFALTLQSTVSNSESYVFDTLMMAMTTRDKRFF